MTKNTNLGNMNLWMLSVFLLMLGCLVTACDRQREETGYHANGTLEHRVRLDANGLYNGDMVHYYKDGKVESILPFTHGEIHGLVLKYYPSGELYAKEKWQAGKRVGLSEYYFKNGKPKYKAYCQDNALVGPTFRYYANGFLHEKILYSPTGEIIDFDKYDKDGRRNLLYTRPLLVAKQDTVEEGTPYEFEVVLANRETEAVFVKFTVPKSDLDSTKGMYSKWRYRIMTRQPGTQRLEGRVYNQRVSGDTLHTRWYGLLHTFYVRPRPSV